MIKKISFIIFIILLSISISDLLTYNDKIIINTLNYEISTTISFAIFLLIAFLILMYLVIYIPMKLLYPNNNSYKKAEKKLKKKFDEYLELISEAFVYKSTRNLKQSFEKLKKANKSFKNTNLSKLLESQLYYLKEEYKKSEEVFKEIKDKKLNLNLIKLEINLKQAKKTKDIKRIEEYAEKILKIEPINKPSIESLLYIYINKKEWEKAYKILEIGLKSKIFELNKIEKDILFVYTSLAKKYYNNCNFSEAKTVLRKAYKINSNNIHSTILLIENYIAIGKRLKALHLIKKTWRNNTNPRLVDLYFSLLTEKEKKSIKSAEILYKINSKSFESNLILAQAYFNQEFYSKARRYAKIAETINETKSLYQLLLKIEQTDNGSSTVINNLKKKIVNCKDPCWKCNLCKKEYIIWQPECDNCKSLNTLKWAE